MSARVVVETLQNTNRWYHVGNPAGFTVKHYDFLEPKNNSSERRPTKAGLKAAEAIMKASQGKLSGLMASQYTLIVQVKRVKDWNALDAIILEALKENFGTGDPIERRQKPRALWDSTPRRAYGQAMIQAYRESTERSLLGYDLSQTFSSRVYADDNLIKDPDFHEMLVEGEKIPPLVRALIKRLTKVEGVAAAKLFEGRLEVWFGIAFDKKAGEPLVDAIVKDIREKQEAKRIARRLSRQKK